MKAIAIRAALAAALSCAPAHTESNSAYWTHKQTRAARLVGSGRDKRPGVEIARG